MEDLLTKNREVKVDPLLTVEAVADILSVHRNTVYQMVQRGNLQAYQIPERSIRISQSSLMNFIAVRQYKPGALQESEMEA